MDIFEKIKGIEEQALVDRLAQDKKLAQLYTQAAIHLIEETADAHLLMKDVSFIDGRNVMFDPETGRIKLIERINLRPSPHQRPNELVTEQLLFTDLPKAKDRLLAHGEDNLTVLMAEMLRYFADLYGKDALYFRAVRITPRNPLYRKFVGISRNLYPRNDISDSEFISILAEHDSGKDHNIAIYHGDRYTKAVDPKLVQAALIGNYREFVELLGKGQVETEIDNPDDPRYAPLVLPDEIFYHETLYLD